MIGRMRWWIPALAACLCGGLLIYVYRANGDIGDALIIPGVVAALFAAICTWVMVRTRHWRRRLEGVEQTPATTFGSLAWRLWHRARVDSLPEGTLNAAAWIHQTGPEGPRVLLVDAALPHFGCDAQVFEETPLGMDQTLGPKERKARITQVCFFGFGIVMASYMFFHFPLTSGFMIQPTLMIALYGCMILFALYRLGVRPVQFGAASVAPGLIRTTRRGTERLYTRRDSLLIIRPVQNRLEARIVRDTGEFDKFAFHTGNADPALHELIARWSWRENAGVTWSGHATREFDPIAMGQPTERTLSVGNA